MAKWDTDIKGCITGADPIKLFTPLEKIYKPILKGENTLWLRKYFFRLLGCYP